MSFIDQKAAVRMLVRKKALQIDQRIKKIVVIADDDVAKKTEVKRKLKRIDLMQSGIAFDDVSRNHRFMFQNVLHGRANAIVVADKIRVLIVRQIFFLVKRDLVFGSQRN